MKTKEQALRELGLVGADAAAIFMKLTPEESARRVWTPYGPTLTDLTAQITATRAKRRGAVDHEVVRATTT